MKHQRFLNALRVLHGLDRHEVEWMPDSLWKKFRDSPVRALLQMDDAMAVRVLDAVEKRQPPPPAHFAAGEPGVILYDATPGGRRGDDGHMHYSLTIPVLTLTSFVENRQEVAAAVIEALNKGWNQ